MDDAVQTGKIARQKTEQTSVVQVGNSIAQTSVPIRRLRRSLNGNEQNNPLFLLYQNQAATWLLEQLFTTRTRPTKNRNRPSLPCMDSVLTPITPNHHHVFLACPGV